MYFYKYKVFLYCYVICSYRNRWFPKLFVLKDELLGDLMVLFNVYGYVHRNNVVYNSN